jgi:hypothetical protein
MAMTQQVNTRLILTVGAVSGLLIVVISIGTQAWFQSEENREITEKWDAPSSVPVSSLAIDSSPVLPDQPLDEYRWADAKHQVAVIPVTEAMKLMVEKNGQLPTTQPATTPSTEPAAAPK